MQVECLSNDAGIAARIKGEGNVIYAGDVTACWHFASFLSQKGYVDIKVVLAEKKEYVLQAEQGL